MKIFTKQWFKAAGIRAIKTMAQVAASLFTIDMAFNEVDWLHIVSVAVVAGFYSALTSVAGIPEIDAYGNEQAVVEELTNGKGDE